MSEYNIDKSSNLIPKEPNYLMAILAGLGTGLIVAIVLAVIGIWLEAEYFLALAVGAVIVAVAIHNFVPQKSVAGAIIGAILCPATYFMYQIIMSVFGYYYEGDGNTFWWMLGGSVILGAYMGYNNIDD